MAGEACPERNSIGNVPHTPASFPDVQQLENESHFSLTMRSQKHSPASALDSSLFREYAIPEAAAAALEPNELFLPVPMPNFQHNNFFERGAGAVSPTQSFLSTRTGSPRLRKLVSFSRSHTSLDRHSASGAIRTIPLLEDPIPMTNLSFPTHVAAPVPPESFDGETSSYRQQLAALCHQQTSTCSSSSQLPLQSNQLFGSRYSREQEEGPHMLETNGLLSSPEQSPPPMEMSGREVQLRGSGSSDSGFTDLTASRSGGVAAVVAPRSGLCSCPFPIYHRILSTQRASIIGTPVYACSLSPAPPESSFPSYTSSADVGRSISQYVPKQHESLTRCLHTPEPLRVALPEHSAGGPADAVHGNDFQKIARQQPDSSCYASLV